MDAEIFSLQVVISSIDAVGGGDDDCAPISVRPTLLSLVDDIFKVVDKLCDKIEVDSGMKAVVDEDK
jgi:hypothetical protein